MVIPLVTIFAALVAWIVGYACGRFVGDRQCEQRLSGYQPRAHNSGRIVPPKGGTAVRR